MKKVIVLSGGMDSLTALAVALDEGHEIITLNFQYGSKHNKKESDAIDKIVAHYKVPLKQITLNLNDYIKSDLLTSGGEIPEGHYADENMKKTVIPFRNGIMLAIAAGFAESENAQALVLGNHAGDHAIYPDCREDFSTAMRQAIHHGTYNNLRLETPFIHMSKGNIVELGNILKVPYELAWSCYKGEDVACGKCGTCVERLEAFHEAGSKDPIPYQDEQYWKSLVSVK